MMQSSRGPGRKPAKALITEENKEEVMSGNSSQANPTSQKLQIQRPVQMERPLSTVGPIQSGDLRVVPLLAVDFSMGNLTFDASTCLHHSNPNLPNDYKDLLGMLSTSFKNILNLPIFGFGAKTSNFSNQTCHLFPLSRSIRNPFTPNDSETIDATYNDCLQSLELAVPVNLCPLVTFFKKLGLHQQKRLRRKAKHESRIRGTFDTFFVLYILSTGIMDDVQDLIKELQSKEWKSMPLQIHLMSMAPNHLAQSDQDSA